MLAHAFAAANETLGLEFANGLKVCQSAAKSTRSEVTAVASRHAVDVGNEKGAGTRLLEKSRRR